MFSMSLTDLVRAHQRDLNRRAERQSVLRDARLVGSTSRLTSWLAHARRPSRRPDVSVTEYVEPAWGAVVLVPPMRRVLSTETTFGATVDDRCAGCCADVG